MTTVGQTLKHDTVNGEKGEMITHENDVIFDQGQNGLSTIEAKQAIAQLNLDQSHALIQLTKKSPRAAEIFLFLVQNMDNYNTLVCSYKVFEESLGMSTATVTRAIRVLKDSKFVDIKKIGTGNIYIINKEIVWKLWETNYKYAEFGAKVIIVKSEQEQEHKTESSEIKKRTIAEVIDKK